MAVITLFGLSQATVIKIATSLFLFALLWLLKALTCSVARHKVTDVARFYQASSPGGPA